MLALLAPFAAVVTICATQARALALRVRLARLRSRLLHDLDPPRRVPLLQAPSDADRQSAALHVFGLLVTIPPAPPAAWLSRLTATLGLLLVILAALPPKRGAREERDELGREERAAQVAHEEHAAHGRRA